MAGEHCDRCQAPDGVSRIDIGPLLDDSFGRVVAMTQLNRAAVRAAREGQGAELVDSLGRVVGWITPATGEER